MSRILAWVLAVAAVTASTPLISSVGRFSDREADLQSSLVSGAFAPATAPRPVVSVESGAARVRWQPVTFPGSSMVSYVVNRTQGDGSSTQVCPGVSNPVPLTGEVSCTDSSIQPGVSYTYSVQPVLVRSGSPTWSLLAGPPSDAIVLTSTVFAGAGPVVNTTTSGIISVPYPVGTEVGDLLILVVVNGRNKAPRRPTGWTDFVSRGIGGAQDFHLYAVQRIADGANSVQVDIDTGTEGASLQVIRYDVPAGSAAPIARASQVQSGFSTTATAQLVPTPDIITTSAATAISIVAVRANNALSLLPGSAWTLRSASATVPGATSLAWAIADSSVGAASTVASPTWQQSGTPARWIFGGSAFG